MDITSLTAVELGKKIKAKEISVVEAVKASIAQIEKVEKDVNSFVTLDKEGALKRAKEVQAKIDAGELTGPLAGVPVAIKDNMCTKGLLTTCSSKILYNFVRPTQRRRSLIWKRQERSSSARRTWMSLLWEARPRPRRTA